MVEAGAGKVRAKGVREGGQARDRRRWSGLEGEMRRERILWLGAEGLERAV